MAKQSRIEMKKPVAALHDFLSEWQMQWLKKELLLWKFMPGEFERLRAAPYPLDPRTAALIEYLGAEYVLPWPVAQVEFERWLYPVFRDRAVQTVAEFNDLSRQEAEDQFASLDRVEQLGLCPVVDALPGDWASEFAEECVEYEQALRTCLEGTGLLRKCVRMPYLPLGGVLLSFIPLIEGVWIDLEALALSEACASLMRAGYVRLESDDPHRLARHRLYPRRTWWGYPKPSERHVFLDAADRARLSLAACPARTRMIAGRQHIDFGEYAAREDRGIPSNPGAGLCDGLWLEGWNAWAQDPDVQQHGLAGLPVAPLTHPCRFGEDKDYARFESQAEAEAALGARRQEFDATRSIALGQAGRAPGYWPFSDHQVKVLDALDGSVMGDIELALALEQDEAFERQDDDDPFPTKLRSLYRELALLLDMGLVVNDRTRGGYYRPDRPPTPRK